MFRWTIGRKLAAAFIAVVALFTTALTLALVMQGQSTAAWNELGRWQQGQDAVEQTVTGARIQQAAQALYAITGDERYRREWERGVTISDGGATKADRLKDATITRIAASAVAADHRHDETVNGKLFPAIRRGDATATLAALRLADRYVRVPLGASLRIGSYVTSRATPAWPPPTAPRAAPAT